MKAIKAKVLRSMTDPRSRGLRAAILRNAKEIELRTPAGIFLGRTGKVEVDTDRIVRVLQRIIRGLAAAARGRPIPPGSIVEPTGLEALDQMGIVERNRMVKQLIHPTLAQEPGSIGDVLRYFVLDDDDRGASFWLLEFFNSSQFMAFVLPESEAFDEDPEPL